MTKTRSGRGNGWGVALGLTLVLAGCTPPGPRALLDGERLLQEGKSGEALRRLRTAVEFLPNNAQAWNHLGLALHASRQATEAIDAYQHALQLDRNLAAAHYNLGCLYQEQGDAARASDAFGTFVQLQPRALEGWVRLGQVQLKARRWDQAERSFQTALRQMPGDPEALNGLGVALHQRRRVADAWGCFTNAVARQPDFAPAWLNLAVAAQQSGLKSFAAQAYRHYASLDPESARALGVPGVADHLEAAARPVYQLPPASDTTLASRGSTEAPTNSAPARTNPVVALVRPPSGPTSVVARVSQALARAETNLASVDVTRRPVATNGVGALPQESRPAGSNPPPTLATAPASKEPKAPPMAPPTNRVAQIDKPSRSDPAPTNTLVLASLPKPEEKASPAPAPVVPVVPLAAATKPAPPATNGVSLAGSLTRSNSVPATPTEPMLLAARTTNITVERLDPPPAAVSAQVRDEPPIVPAFPATNVAALSGTDAAASFATNAPLVRPVARQVVGEDEEHRNGFWSRANPVHWFGEEEGKSEAKPGGEVGVGDDGTGRWRWANPGRWFRGERGPEDARTPTPVGSGFAARPASPVPAPNATTNVVPPPQRVSVEPVAAPRRVAMTTSPAARPAATMPAVAAEPAKEYRRYAYRNPAAPRAGDVVAAQDQVALGVQEHRRNRMDAAIRCYETARNLDPASFEAWHNLALAHLQRGEISEALEASEHALAVQPDSPAARFTLALALDRGGFPADAATEAERVVRRRSDDAAGHLLLGNIYSQRLGDPARARTHYLRVIELQPDHPQSIAIRNWLSDHR